MKKADRKVELLKKLQKELDRRTQVEEAAVRLISNGECEKACDLLNALDDSIVKEIEHELDQLDEKMMPKASKEGLSGRINTLIDDTFESIKAESSTYDELKNDLKKVTNGMAWENPGLASYIKKRFRMALDKEIGGLNLK